MNVFAELRRRNVFRVGIAYLVVAWVLLQVADLVLENIDAPGWVMQVFMLAVAIGFPLVLLFAWAFELTPEGIKREKDVDRTRSITRQTGRKLDRAIIVILALALGYFAWDKFLGRSSGNPGPSVAEETTPPVAETDKSIAVLPFVNMSSDAEQEYFSDGISEEILNALAQVKDLKVAGRTSSFAFKGQNLDLRQVGETLGVNHILEGSVRKAGDRVRITAQLVKTDDGFHLWSDTYDRELTDVFAIQDEIAGAILHELRSALLDERPTVTQKVDPFAYDLYLNARQKIRDRTRQSLENAAALLDQAIALDDGFAGAYAQRAITELLLSEDHYGTLPGEQARETARAWIDRSLALDAGLAEGWAAQGLYWWQSRRHSEKNNAEEPLLRALSINPSLTDASNWLQGLYGGRGEQRKALGIVEQMVDRDPLYRPGFGNAVRLYGMMGRLDDVRGLIERFAPVFPDDPMLLDARNQLFVFQGRFGDALPLVREAWQAQPDNSGYRFMYATNLMLTAQYEEVVALNFAEGRVAALSQLGRTEEALMLARELAASGEDPGAMIHLLGRNGRFQELVGYVDQRWPDLDAWQEEFTGLGGFGNMNLALLANAYRDTDDLRFEDALSRLAETLRLQRDAGVDNVLLLQSEAYHGMLAGEQDRALDKLAAAVDRGLITTPRIVDSLPVFRALEGEPRYEAIQHDMLDHLNAERAKLALQPVTLERTL